MATPLADAYTTEPVASPARVTLPKSPPKWPGFLREPLLHFVLFGALLFAVDQVLVGKADDPTRIVIGADVDREAIATFKATRNREPNAKELEALRKVWLDNEVLYREGLALGVDKGDPAIRERVIFKALSVVDSNVKVPPPNEQLLRAWFEAHREKYDEPPRFDFDEAALSGQSTETAVRDFVKELNAGTPGDAKAGLRVFKGRPRANLVDSYGADFERALESATPGTWQALLTRDGWRAVRLNALKPAKPAVFDSIRGPVLQDWSDATAAEQRSAAVRALTKKYKVRYESGK